MGDTKTWLFTVFSFVNAEKYPPSLVYLLMTLGPALLALALFERVSGPINRFFVTLGRVPLFYYLLHLVVIHGLAVVFAYARYGQADFMFRTPPLPITTAVLPFPEGYGYGLVTVYAIWVGIVVSLYPLCRWFANLKGRRREAWLSYL